MEKRAEATDILRQERLLIDGGMGTMLLHLGLKAGKSPDHWCIEEPDKVLSVHKAYASAGAMLLTSDTFGSNACRQKRGPYAPADLARAGVSLCRRAANEADHACYAALDVGPLGEFIEPLGDLTFEEAVEIFRAPVEGGVDAGADCILIETMSDVAETKAALAAAKTFGRGLPVFATFTFDANGRLLTGLPIERVVSEMEAAGADAIGCNCGLGPDQFVSLLPRLIASATKPVLMSPNAGLPVYKDGETVYNVSPAAFACDMLRLAEGGAWGLGGCCGTTPAHIEAVFALLKQNGLL